MIPNFQKQLAADSCNNHSTQTPNIAFCMITAQNTQCKPQHCKTHIKGHNYQHEEHNYQ